ncbi:MAG: AAA family ATPase [Desulfovermiculus sp.]
MPASWLIAAKDLTLEQQRAVTLEPDRPRVVLGPPGSGKTVILAHRAKYLCEAYQVPPSRCMILTSTKALGSYIRTGLRDLGLELRLVQPLDAWCRSFHQTFLGPLPESGQYAGPEGPRQAVREHLAHEWTRGKLFDFVLVDEVQKPDRTTFDILRRIAEHVTVFRDSVQQSFDADGENTLEQSLLGPGQITTALLEGYRCSPHIAGLAARFIPDPEQATRFLRQTGTLCPEKERPVLFLARDEEEELQKLICTLQARQSLGERIAVLVPGKKQILPIIQACREQGLHVEGPAAKASGQGSSPLAYDFSTDRPKIMTYHSAVGLTFDTVFMPRLSTNHFRGNIASKKRKFLFLGVTRAVRWAYLSATRDSQISPVEALLKQGRNSLEQGQVSVRHGNYPRQIYLPGIIKSDRQTKPQGRYDQEEVGDPAVPGEDYADLF